MKNTVRAHRNGATKSTASQVQTTESTSALKATEAAKQKYYGVLNRPVSYEEVRNLADHFEAMTLVCNEVITLLDLGVNLVKENGQANVAESYSSLVSAAQHRLRVASNTVHDDVFNIEPRIDDDFKTGKQLEADIIKTGNEVAS